MSALQLYMAQRITALIMVPFVLVHLLVMIVAIQGGLSAGEILARTQGSLAWFAFYGMFVVAVAIHGAIGLRGLLIEWAGLGEAWAGRVSAVLGLLLLLLGARAVWAVTWAASWAEAAPSGGAL